MGVSGHFALCCTTGLVGRAPSDPMRLTILARTARRRVRQPSLTRRNYLSLCGVRITLAWLPADPLGPTDVVRHALRRTCNRFIRCGARGL